MKTKIIRACDMIEIPRKLLHDPELTLAAKGVAGTLVAFNDRDYGTTELAEESGTNETELLDALVPYSLLQKRLKVETKRETTACCLVGADVPDGPPSYGTNKTR